MGTPSELLLAVPGLGTDCEAAIGRLLMLGAWRGSFSDEPEGALTGSSVAALDGEPLASAAVWSSSREAAGDEFGTPVESTVRSSSREAAEGETGLLLLGGCIKSKLF